MNFTALPSEMNLYSDMFQSPMTIGLAGFAASFISFLAYLSYSPRTDKKSPPFTSDTVPFIGSWGFFSRRWGFWKKSMLQSKTGNFSFWLGKYHLVGVAGESARRLFLDNRDLSFDNGYATLHGIGPEITLPIHEIFEPKLHNGRSYFHRRLIDLTRTGQLAKRLPSLTRDAHNCVAALAKNPSGVTNPFNACYPIVLALTCRTIGTDEISDTPKLLESCLRYCLILQSCSSGHNVAIPWAPSMSYLKRWIGRYGLSGLITPIVNERMKKGAPRVDDALQVLIDNGDSKDYIINFFISTLFAALVNAGILAGGLLFILSHHTVWQDKIFGEIQAAVRAHSTNKGASLVDQLDTLPLEAWESSFPSIDLCFKEAIRMNTAFAMFRQNMARNCIPIPGTNEVIPAGGFAAYHTADVHYNEELYPNPTKFEPERFLEGREEFKKQMYGFVGWGNGRHPCLGMRWAKLQQNIILVYALALFKWNACDENGEHLPPSDRKKDLDSNKAGLPQGVYCKYVPREKA